MRAAPMPSRPETRFPRCEVELTSLDLRYEGCRLKQAAVEERLLASIAERGFDEALEGVEMDRRRVLLNGFKRHRCARKLRLGTVPYVSMGADPATGITALLKLSNDRGLSILEQAAFVDELHRACSLSVSAIAVELDRSKAWVSLRLGLLSEMSAVVREKLFAGAFPVYAYMYTLRPFMRINKGSVDEFVAAVSGRGLSVRDIERLARGFFHGGEALRAEIARGHLTMPLERLRAREATPADGCSEFESRMLRDLEWANQSMVRVRAKSEDQRLASLPFHAQAHLLTEGILSRADGFVAAVRRLHDRSGPA